MTHLVASMTLDSARSCVMQGAFLTQGKASSMPTVFSWRGSISPKGFLPSIMLLAVIIVAVAIVVTVVLVVVDAINGVIIVVVGLSSIIKLSFVIIGDLVGLFYSNRLGIFIPPGQGISVNEANCSFHTIEVERLAAYELFIVSFSCYMSSLGPVFLLPESWLVLQMLMSFWEVKENQENDKIESKPDKKRGSVAKPERVKSSLS
uniref:Uncharacterized protein n=1 Tax=Tanacetum cinerariifolium TaxID=118510 RepID=A0A699JKU3_TANCI|nr:hypothetical protein [Tanacetum cinerariifolium]